MVPNLLKPSRLGEIPQDWKRVRLSEVMKVRQGLQIAISDRLKEPTSTSKEYITIQSIKKTDQDREYVEAPSQRVICTKDDVLMTRTGNTGIVVTDVEGAFHNNFFLMDFDKDKIDKTFLVNYLRSPRVQHLILTKAGASTIPDLNHKDFYSVEFPLAPVLEQQKIAKILTTWDKAISTTERLIENSTQQKKALMQQLLTGKKRLLDESGKRFESEWEEVIVSSFGKVVTGSTPPKNAPSNYGGNISWATAEDFKQKYVSNTKVKLTDLGATKARVVPKGSVLVTCIASIGKNAIANEDLATNQQINSVVINKDNSNEFFYYLIEFNTHKLLAWAGTTAVPILNKTSFEKVKFIVPNLKEQQKIATVLTNADKEIDLLERQLAGLQQEKKALMQVLLTGKVRVVVDG